MNTVVVTGAAGFAGCNLTEKLIEQGCTVYACLRPASEHNKRLEPLMASGKLIPVKLDISEITKLPELIEKFNSVPDTFFHLAWNGGRDDFHEQYKNVDDTVNALEVCAKLGCKRFICTGSQAEYGITDKVQTENMMPNPFSAYGAAKTAAMYLTRRRAKQLNTEWIWGRIFSLYGKYEPSNTLIQYLINAAKNNEEIHVTSASQNWDYLDAGDCAEALIALGEHGKDEEIYNIAYGDYRPLKEFIAETVTTAAKYSDCSFSLHNSDKSQNISSLIHYDKTAEAAVSLQPSIDKIKRDTGWFPKTRFGEKLPEYCH